MSEPQRPIIGPARQFGSGASVRAIRDSQGRIVAEVNTETADVRTIRRGEVVEFNARTGEVRRG